MRIHFFDTYGLALVVALGAAGCARRPAVSAEGLALRRVVVYRNGVGYFERAGHIAESEVTFKVRGNEVGDFLATLAVIEQGGSSVRSASFPIKVAKPEGDKSGSDDADSASGSDDGSDDRDEDRPVPPRPGYGGMQGRGSRAPGVRRPPRKEKPDPNKLETVVLELDGKEHDLQVGYVAETPVWRPSYRLVIEKGGADLQAWGIVQNLSGEDWKSVSLSLIAGAPLAFEAELGKPVIPPRPTVTDEGEVIAAVPRSETSLSQEAPAAPPPPPAAPNAAPMQEAGEPSLADLEEEAQDKASFVVADKKAARKDENGPGHARQVRPAAKAGRAVATSESAGYGRGAAGGAPMPSRPAPIVQPAAPRANPSGPRNLSALAAIAVEGGATRYDIPTPITVPDKSATMVMLLSKRVPGEAIFLFAPDNGVPDSQAHPFRVARFTNDSGGLLEKGPIAIFQEGAFLGQGMVDPLPNGAIATVPFALERSLAVNTDRTFGEEGARLAKIESGEIFIERDAITRTHYRAKNGGDKPAKLMVKHGRTPSTRLYQPPKGTEDNVGTGTALVPLDAAPRATAEMTIDERRAVERGVDWLSQLADDAVRAYMADKRAQAATVAQLKSAWDVRTTLVRAVEEQKKLNDERSGLETMTEETRRNLRAIEKNKVAADLRQKLTERLTKSATRLDEITKRLIEVDMQVNEQRVRFTDMIRTLKVLDAPKPE